MFGYFLFYIRSEPGFRRGFLLLNGLENNMTSCCSVTTQTGSLNVTSTPISASVYVDGYYKGLTPLTISNLSIGNHTVRVAKSVYSSYQVTRYIYAGTNYIDVNLTKV